MQNPSASHRGYRIGEPIGLMPSYAQRGTLTVLDGQAKTKEEASRQVDLLNQQAAQERAARKHAFELMERSANGELLTESEMQLIRAIHRH